MQNNNNIIAIYLISTQIYIAYKTILPPFPHHTQIHKHTHTHAHTRTCALIYVFIIFTQPLRSGRIWHKVNFLSGVQQVWIQSCPSFRLVASPRLKNQSALLFIHSWRENNWIHTFPKGISAMWNAISVVQDLNSCCRVHFLWWWPLHHGHLLYICVYMCVFLCVTAYKYKCGEI